MHILFRIFILLLVWVPSAHADTQVVALKKGWNLISTSLKDTRVVGDIFSGVAEYVMTYTPEGEWQRYDLTIANGSLTTVLPHQGLWVRAGDAGQVEFKGEVAVVSYATLNEGWNLIGPGGNISPDQLRNTLTQKLNASINSLFAFDPEVGWSFFNFDRNLGTLTALQEGQGVWVKLTPMVSTARRVQPAHLWIFAPGRGEETLSAEQPLDFTVMTGVPLQFAPFGLQNDGSLQYLWQFGGAAVDSTEQKPGNVTFATAGTYTVTLTITDSDGNMIATETRKIMATTQEELAEGMIATDAMTFLVRAVFTNTFTHLDIFVPRDHPAKLRSIEVLVHREQPINFPETVQVTTP